MALKLYKCMSLLGIAESHSFGILLAIILVVGPIMGAFPSQVFPTSLGTQAFFISPGTQVLNTSSGNKY